MSSSATVRAERTKLLAAYLNTIAAGFAVTGVIGPMASYLYGTAATQRQTWQLCAEIGSLVFFSLVLHVLARVVLGRLG